jgi:hypothetical protein
MLVITTEASSSSDRRGILLRVEGEGVVTGKTSSCGALVGLALLVSLVCVVGASAGRQASIVRIKASLNAGQEVPPPAHKVARATGTFTATFRKTPEGYTMVLAVEFREPQRARFERVCASGLAWEVRPGTIPSLFALLDGRPW